MADIPPRDLDEAGDLDGSAGRMSRGTWLTQHVSDSAVHAVIGPDDLTLRHMPGHGVSPMGQDARLLRLALLLMEGVEHVQPRHEHLLVIARFALNGVVYPSASSAPCLDEIEALTTLTRDLDAALARNATEDGA